jgi:hypothetical protein
VEHAAEESAERLDVAEEVEMDRSAGERDEAQSVHGEWSLPPLDRMGSSGGSAGGSTAAAGAVAIAAGPMDEGDRLKRAANGSA